MDRLLDLLGADKATAANTAIRIAIVVVLTAVLAKVVTAVFKRVEKKRRMRGQTFGFVRFLKYVLLALLYAAALMAVVSGSAKNALSTLLASSGVVAVVLSIACQEPIGNLCSGVIIILTSPFKIGDIVRHIGINQIGVVEEITLRHTVIRTFENRRLFIPNSNMNKAAIENSNYGDSKICMPLEFTVTYDSDLEVAMQVVRNAIMRHPQYDDAKAEEDRRAGKEPVQVLINRLETLGIVLKVWVWAESSSASYKMKSDITLEVWKHFKYAHVEFAHPHTLPVAAKKEPTK
ncbi:MAG: mechanosensitive ion channel family protein [Oscillospiraceae bacterium]|jgi:small-conductance mechanosensitive channel|nr:mechanosensitive ion channel family protein [Oscillospiraceae bacterium]